MMSWRKPSSEAKWKACKEEEDHAERGTLTLKSGLDANYIKHPSWQSTVIDGELP